MNSPLDDLGLDKHWADLYVDAATETSVLGRVVRQDRGYVMVATVDGEVLAKTRAGKRTPVVTGDWVVVEHEAVIKVLERRSLLSRQDALGRAEQPLVANVDIVFIVCGADRPLNTRRIERAVTQASEANATPVVVVTKVDLLDNTSPLDELSNQLPSVEVVGVSSRAKTSLERLNELLHQSTSVMFGESGAGKSTLLNALLGNDVVATGKVRSGDAKGRHTTVRRELFLLPGGGILIDTPGVRSLGLWASAESVDAAFPDLSELATQCRFSDCSHHSEPGCALTEALDRGEIASDRLDSYRQLQEEVAAAERRQEEKRRKNRR